MSLNRYLNAASFGLILLLALTSFRVVAAPPNAIGTFSASGIATERSGSSGSCPLSLPISPASGTTSITLEITSQVDTSISGSLTIITPGGSTLTTSNISGTLDNNGNFYISGTSTGSFADVFLQGTFDGSSVSVSSGNLLYLASPAISNLCHQNSAAFSLSFGGGNTINPEEAAGTELKDTNNVRVETQTIENPVHDHLRKTMHGDAKGGKLKENGFLLEGEGGLNAGDWQLDNLGVWLSYNYTETENDFSRTAFESDRHTVVGGVDFTPTDNTVLGVAFAYEDASTDTTFNAGELDSDGYTIAPYLGVLLSETWSLDFSFGLSFIDNEQFRTSGGTRITSSPDTDRFYISGNLNGVSYVDNWILGGRIGYLYARSSTEAFTESNGNAVAKNVSRLGQLRIGGDAAYSFGNWEPFAMATYEYDFEIEEVRLTTGAQPDNDRSGLMTGLGIRYYNNNWYGSFEYNTRLMRDDYDEDSWTATLRYDF